MFADPSAPEAVGEVDIEEKMTVITVHSKEPDNRMGLMGRLLAQDDRCK